MDSQQTFYLLATTIVLVNLSFIFKATWWRNFQLYTLKKEEKYSKNIHWWRKIVEHEIKFAKGKYGLWLFRGLGIIWLSYTCFLLFSFLKEMQQ